MFNLRTFPGMSYFLFIALKRINGEISLCLDKTLLQVDDAKLIKQIFNHSFGKFASFHFGAAGVRLWRVPWQR